ncbi:MAG: regulatory protein RecX [Candidatus Gracilibacteria bacterium]|jgi:regulatory protein|nr:regulatory protein RecX [Candidatus Gracilibacteria bacterium]MDD5178954.1 regulatory protein RecX [Candidatus Gracilibacteria bacterium]
MFKKKRQPREADSKQVFDYACWLLARRAYSTAELLKKFRTTFIPNEEIFEATLQKLKKLKFQSDESFAQGFVEMHRDWGKRRLELELAKKGITKELIADAIPSEEDEVARCREALLTKLRGKEIPSEWKEKQKLLAFLARRGFDLDVIQKILIS